MSTEQKLQLELDFPLPLQSQPVKLAVMPQVQKQDAE
jgi:hypothetical protein